MPKIITETEEEKKKREEEEAKEKETETSESKPDESFFFDEKKEEEEETEETEEEAEEEKVESEEEETEEETEETEEEETDEDPRDAEIARLQKIVEDMSESLNTDISEITDRPAKEKEGKKVSKKDVEKAADSALVGEMDDAEFDRITQDKDAFIQFLNRFGEGLVARASQNTLQTVPDVISKSFKRQMTLKQATDNFYAENSDLKKHANYVGYIFSKKQAESPDKGINDLLKETETEVRKNLSLNKKAVEREKERLKDKQTKKQPSRPATPGSGRGANRTQGADTRTDQQKQIDDILI